MMITVKVIQYEGMMGMDEVVIKQFTFDPDRMGRGMIEPFGRDVLRMLQEDKAAVLQFEFNK